jgi:hypothetical protein
MVLVFLKNDFILAILNGLEIVLVLFKRGHRSYLFDRTVALVTPVLVQLHFLQATCKESFLMRLK